MSELRIMEWQGKYRIESGRQDGDKWWADKIRRKVWDKETHSWKLEDKDRNLSLPLGDLVSARLIMANLNITLELEGNFKQVLQEPIPPSDSDVPF